MKMKKIALLGVAAVAGLSLASCNGNDDNKVNKTLDVHVNYNGTGGISYLGSSQFTNTIDNVTYKKGDLLPTWQAFAKNLDLEIRDASDYSTKKDDDNYNAVSANNFKDDQTKQNEIDLYYNSVKNINKMGTSGKAIDLSQHLDKMPNFKAYLEKYPTVRKMITTDGAIYYTPYMDGFNDIEKMFMMDTEIAEKILDATSFDNFDTTTNGGANPAANVVKKGAYTPFIDADHNYKDAETTVSIVKDGKKAELKIKQTTNIIKQQNELLAAGCTGKQLAEQFRTYLTAAFGDNVGSGKVYAKYSEIFTGVSAAYNCDELIALMRVVKANPGVVTGDPTKEVETLFPRGHENNRMDNIMDFASIWGVQGLVSEKDMLYYDANGKLNDAATTQGTYDSVLLLSAIYDEGLILEDFYKKAEKQDKTIYLDRYFKKTGANAGYGFLMYDYAATQAAANDIKDGVGTDLSKRQIKKADGTGINVQGIAPVLPPLTYWGFEKTWDHTQALSNKTGKILTRYTEDNRALKSNSWCIPANTDNLDAALKLMDYMFSVEGSRIQDFGPEGYWELGNVNGVDGQSPVMATKVKEMLAASGKDFWSFMRENIGSTHGIGCERSKGLDIQATNFYAQEGLGNLKLAISLGVVDLALVDKVSGQYTYDTCVQTSGFPSQAAAVTDKFEAVTQFWAADKWADTASGWVVMVINPANTDFTNTKLGSGKNTGEYTYAKLKEQISVKDKEYLYPYASSIDASVVPDYCKK